MHLLVDICSHGFGDLAQTAPVIEALRCRVPNLRLTVRSSLPRAVLERRIRGEVAHIPETRDVGLVMHNAVDIDLAASAQRYRDLHDDWRGGIAAEGRWIKDHRIDAVVTNVAYGMLVEAACSGIPILYLEREDWPESPYFAAWLRSPCALAGAPARAPDEGEGHRCVGAALAATRSRRSTRHRRGSSGAIPAGGAGTPLMGGASSGRRFLRRRCGSSE